MMGNETCPEISCKLIIFGEIPKHYKKRRPWAPFYVQKTLFFYFINVVVTGENAPADTDTVVVILNVCAQDEKVPLPDMVEAP